MNKPGKIELLQLFGHNLFQSASSVVPANKGIITSVRGDIGKVFITIDGKDYDRDPSIVLLHKKPTTRISNIDMASLIEILGLNEPINWRMDNDYKEELARKFLEETRWCPEYPIIRTQQAMGFLHEKGYATRYGKWSVDDLVEMKIYELK